MRVSLRSAKASHVGLVRTNNEDSVFAGRRLIAVADGMGGMPAGELASEIVIKALIPLEDKEPGDASAALIAAVDEANNRIREVSESDHTQDGMGTTVTAALLSGDQVALLHVGDSRCYLQRDGSMSQVTKDDTFVQSLVDQGVLTAAEARSHPRRSVVTQAVQGVELEPLVTIMGVHAGDRFLVCSDGLSDYVTEDAIADVIRDDPDPTACADRLIDLALGVGAPDNVTVVVADVVGA